MRESAGADTTYIREGTYSQNSALSLTSADSNSTFSAYQGEKVVISGGKTVGGWTEGANGVWTTKVNVADIQQFTVNGERQTEARYPNYDASDPIRGGWLWAEDLPSGDPSRQMAYNKADFAAGELAAGMKVTVFSEEGYSSDVLTIQSVDTGSGVITFAEEATYELGARSRFFVSDGKVHLDKAGEWWFDEATQTLHYRPKAGFDGSGAVASTDISLININGADNITIKGLTFSDAATKAATDDIFTAGINVQQSNNIVIDGNEFVNLAKGVRLVGNSHHNTIANNEFTHIWASAIDLQPGSHENTVKNNSIQFSGEVFRTSGAIQMDESWGNLISHNLIRDVPRFGIGENNYDPDTKSGGNIIEYNEILRSGQETPDVAAIYFYSHLDANHLGAIVRFNKIVDSGGLNTVDGAFVAGDDFSSGIYLDDYTDNAKIYGNFVSGTVIGGVYLHGGRNNEVYNNILLDNEQFGVHLFEIDRDMDGTSIHHNIIQNSNQNENTIDLDPDIISPDSIYQNIYYSPGGSNPRIADVSFASWLAMGGDLGSIVTTNPGFTNPAAGDYSLKPGSVALVFGFVDLPWGQIGLLQKGVVKSGTVAGDALHGTAFGDTLTGLGGADSLMGREGDDFMAGGAGSDIYVVDSTGDTVSEAAGQGIDLVRSSVSRSLGANQENLTLAGGVAINGSGNGVNNTIIGNGAANTLNGLAGNDTMAGGGGDDIYVVDSSGDRVSEDPGKGVDLVRSFVTRSLGANQENLALMGTAAINGIGNDGANKMTGNSAANTLNGGAGNDTMAGGGGNDFYIVEQAGDVVSEAAGQGIDLVRAHVNYTLAANVENLMQRGDAAINATGNALANKLTGNGAANILKGVDGDDIIAGGGGADTITGGLGRDRLEGDAGADVFDFNSLAESPALADRDIIVDFNAGTAATAVDLIDLSTIDANTGVAGNQAFVFIGQDTFKAGVAGRLRATLSGDTIFIAGDVNGDGAADFKIAITNTINLAHLTGIDFVL